jgi:uncharacterized membrane protein YadS
MRILTVIGLLAILVGIGAAGFFFGGIYSVAGTADRSRGATLRHALVVLGLRLTFSPHSELAPGKLLPASPATAVATRGGD